MAGHSKWKNIRLHKGKADAERGKLFAKLSRDLTIAAKSGGGAPESNPRLRLAVDKAKAASMPADNIKRAIQKGTGELAADNLEEITYEGYGPGGVAVIVETETDNRNRTVEKVRTAFNKNGGSLGESGSVAWQFNRVGHIQIPVKGANEEDLMLAALDAGALDVEMDREFFLVTTPFEGLSSVTNALDSAGFSLDSTEIALVPTTTVELEGESAHRMLKLIDVLEELDDVQNVHANFEITNDDLDA